VGGVGDNDIGLFNHCWKIALGELTAFLHDLLLNARISLFHFMLFLDFGDGHF
jgi:hypothetical protein